MCEMSSTGCRLTECVRREANVSEALVSFLNLDGTSGDDTKHPSCVHVADRTSELTLTPMGISFDDPKLDRSDRQALTPGIKTALRRLHVNLEHPTNDRTDQVLGRRRRHSCGTKGSEMHAMFNM